MTISCSRCTQPLKIISKNVSAGDTEPIAEVYCEGRPNNWTLRPHLSWLIRRDTFSPRSLGRFYRLQGRKQRLFPLHGADLYPDLVEY